MARDPRRRGNWSLKGDPTSGRVETADKSAPITLTTPCCIWTSVGSPRGLVLDLLMLSCLRNDIALVGLLCCTFFHRFFFGGWGYGSRFKLGKQKVLFIDFVCVYRLWLYDVSVMEFLGRPEICYGLPKCWNFCVCTTLLMYYWLQYRVHYLC